MKIEDVPAVTVKSEHGMHQIQFPVTGTAPVKLEDGVQAQAIGFGGIFEGEVVEAAVILQDSWEVDESADRPLKMWWSAVQFQSISPRSNGMVRLLEKVFALPPSGDPMRAFFVAKIVSLGDDPKNMSSKPIHLKAFFGEADGVEQSELYVNIDLASKTLVLKEKDPEYRSALLKAMTEAAKK
jgi:hypothetical protein